MQNASTISEEVADTSHSIHFTITLKLNAWREVNEEERKTFATLVRQRARELAFYAQIISGNAKLASVEMGRFSSGNGKRTIDVFAEDLEIPFTQPGNEGD